MEILGHIFSKKAEMFIDDKQKLLKKPIEFIDLKKFTGEKNMFAGIEEFDKQFNLYASVELGGDNFETNIAHELLHAVQYTKKYPYIVSANGNEPEENFATSFRSLVLDLEVEDELKNAGFDSSYFIGIRYQKNLEQLTKRANEINNNDYMEKITAVNLALALLQSSNDKKNALIDAYKGNLDKSLDFALRIVEIIDRIGYTSKEQVFVCQGEINTLLNLWDRLHLYDGIGNILTKSQYRIWGRDERKKYL